MRDTTIAQRDQAMLDEWRSNLVFVLEGYDPLPELPEYLEPCRADEYKNDLHPEWE